MIISGGENIASIEVEQALASHLSVLECAVASAPDERWGEVPFALVTLRPDATASEDELIEHVRLRRAGSRRPRRRSSASSWKTGTGKIQKFVLREGLWQDRNERIGTL